MRIIFTVTEEMDADLRAVADKRGASVSGLIRLYIAEALAAETGKSVDAYKVEQGGRRDRDSKGEATDDA